MTPFAAGAGAAERVHGEGPTRDPPADDETHKMLEAYGVWAAKSMYGKTFMGIVRTTFRIGPNGGFARI